MRPRQVPDEFLQAVEAQRAEAAREGIVRRGYPTPVNRAEVLQQVRLLLEHGDADPTRERLLARVHSQVSLEVPRHAELLAAVGAPVISHGGGLRRVLRRRRRRSSGRR